MNNYFNFQGKHFQTKSLDTSLPSNNILIPDDGTKQHNTELILPFGTKSSTKKTTKEEEVITLFECLVFLIFCAGGIIILFEVLSLILRVFKAMFS